MIKRLRVKFVLINMFLVSLILGFLFFVVLIITNGQLERETVDMMNELARTPLRIERFSVENDNIRLPYFIVEINNTGVITATGGGYFDLSDTDYLEELLHIIVDLEEDTGCLDNYSLRYLRTTTFTGERYVFVDTSSQTAILGSLVRTMLGVTVAAFALFLGISIVLAFWAVHPVDLAWKQQKQFVSDASHELKTPLTVIMTNAELLQDSACPPEQQCQMSSNILVMAEQMRGLVESLLELARMDNGSTKTVKEDLDFSEIVNDALLPFEPMFFEKGLILDSSVESGIRIHGSAPHLRQLTEILLDNAQKYSRPGGRTTVTLRREARHCCLTVADEGDPIAAEDLKKIFRRFYRTDKVRAMDHSYGLGLSIAQSISELHKGKIHAESANGINSFIVTLPTL